MSCKLQLSRWKELIHEIDSSVNKEVPFVFFFHPKEKKEIQDITRRDDFLNPICLDEKDVFNSLNTFPSEMDFHTFLINKKNKIVAMGNPVHNTKVKELYLRILKGDTSHNNDIKMTQAKLNTSHIDYGSFPYNSEQSRTLILTNTGKGMLAIHDIISSCGCSKVSYSKEAIRPGENTKLIVSFKADKSEHFNKTIKIYCNTKDSPYNVMISGNAM